MIGYLDVQAFDAAGYLGGVLVVDEFGLPVEFRHSIALRPTKLQRTLYGESLDRYLRAAVIAVRLLDDLESKPGVILTSDPVLAVGGEEPPIAAWERTGVAALGAAGTLQPFEGASPGFLLQLRAGDPPLRLVTKADPSAYRAMADAVLEAAETMDVTEPPARVRAALALLAVDERAAAA
jgi:hypothetical protein